MAVINCRLLVLYFLFSVLALSNSEFVLADVQWEVAPGRSTVEFKVKHFVLMEVEGKFKSYQGKVVTTSLDNFSNAQVEASIPVSSICTGNIDRDSHLLQEVFFNAEKFPTMDFRSTSVVDLGNGNYEMKGLITIKNVSRPIKFQVVHRGLKSLPNGSIKSSFQATAALNRYDFGLKWNELTETGGMVVDEIIQIVMDVTLLAAA